MVKKSRWRNTVELSTVRKKISGAYNATRFTARIELDPSVVEAMLEIIDQAMHTEYSHEQCEDI